MDWWEPIQEVSETESSMPSGIRGLRTRAKKKHSSHCRSPGRLQRMRELGTLEEVDEVGQKDEDWLEIWRENRLLGSLTNLIQPDNY